MPEPLIHTAFTPGSHSKKSDIRTWHADELIMRVETVADFNALDVAASYADTNEKISGSPTTATYIPKAIYVAELDAVFEYDATLTDADDGDTVLETNDGEKYQSQTRLIRQRYTDGGLLNLFPDAGRFCPLTDNDSKNVTSFSSPTYFTEYNSAALSDGGKFTTNNSTHGGSGAALPATVDDLITKIRDGTRRRHNVEFYVLQIDTGATTTGPKTIDSDTRYLALYNTLGPRPTKSSFSMYVRASGTDSIFFVASDAEIFVDGVSQGTESQIVIDPADDWVHLGVLQTIDLRDSFGYTPALFDIYASASDEFQVAHPMVSAGLTRIDPDIGIVSSSELYT